MMCTVTGKISGTTQIFVLNEAFASKRFNFQTACGLDRCVFSAVSSDFSPISHRRMKSTLHWRYYQIY
jgi:hypothetical protein